MNSNFKEKVLGAFYGYAVGDALGIGTEFMTRTEVKRHYPETLRRYTQILQDAHRSMWDKGEWTTNTSLMLLFAHSLTQNRGLDHTAFARSLVEWYSKGHPDVSSHVRIALSDPDFVNHPKETAIKIWRIAGRATETNDFVGTSIVAGMLAGPSYLDTMTDAIKMMHCGPKVAGATALVSTLAHRIFWEDHILTPDEALAIAERYSDELAPYVELAQGTADEIIDVVSSEDATGDVGKSLTVALRAAWATESFEEGLIRLANIGGDADTNTALGGAIMGLRFGHSDIPAELTVTLRRADVVDRVANRFAEYISNEKTEGMD